MTPVLHHDAIKQSKSSANGVKITQEYSSGHQILSVVHISSILIKIYRKYAKIAPRGRFLDPSVTPVHRKAAIQRSKSTANGVKITQEYSKGNQKCSVGHMFSILIKMCHFSIIAISAHNSISHFSK